MHLRISFDKDVNTLSHNNSLGSCYLNSVRLPDSCAGIMTAPIALNMVKRHVKCKDSSQHYKNGEISKRQNGKIINVDKT